MAACSALSSHVHVHAKNCPEKSRFCHSLFRSSQPIGIVLNHSPRETSGMRFHPHGFKLGRHLFRVFLLALGVPYCLVIGLYIIVGWPDSPPGEGKYQRALQPARVLNLNYAIMQQVGMVRFLPLYYRIRTFYSEAQTVAKDIPFGRNGNTLDVWWPSDAPRRFTDGADPSQPRRKPILVYVFGGAWMSGDKDLYGLLAMSLADKLGAIVCVPNYSIYPKGIVTDMLSDLVTAVAWIKTSETIAALGGDPGRIVLCGHSAGGHLSALATLNLARGSATEAIGAEAKKSPLEATSVLDSIRGVIAIGAVFDIGDHYRFESWRGVEDLSSMSKVMKGPDSFDEYSPTLVVEGLDTQQVAKLPPFVLVHGTEDGTVPSSASEKFAAALTRRGVPVAVAIIQGGGHAPLVLDMMEAGRRYHREMTTVVVEHARRLFASGGSERLSEPVTVTDGRL